MLPGCWRHAVAGLAMLATLFLSGFGYAAASITSIRQLESGESPRFDIKIDQPTTYEAYQMPQVLRYVIDLHHVEPGMVSNLTKLDTPSVKRVLLQQKNLNGLQMTRVIFDLSREMVGRVVTDDGGRRLLVAFTPPTSASPLLAPPSPPAYPATPMPSPTATVVNQLPPLQKKPLLPVVPDNSRVPLNMTPDLAKELEVVRLPPSSPLLLGALSSATTSTPVVMPPPVVIAPQSSAVKPPATVATVSMPIVASPATVPVVAPFAVRPVQQAPLQILAVKIEKDGVLVEISGTFDPYLVATQRKPGKLIIDLPAGTTRIDKPVAINRFGIRMVRVGMAPQKLRLVFDASGDVVTAHEIHRVSNGLKVVFPNRK